MRVSYIGELGKELQMKSADLVDVYQAIEAVGASCELVNFGSYVLNSMCIKQACHGWDTDIDSEYSRYDAGLECFVDYDKPAFIG